MYTLFILTIFNNFFLLYLVYIVCIYRGRCEGEGLEGEKLIRERLPDDKCFLWESEIGSLSPGDWVMARLLSRLCGGWRYIPSTIYIICAQAATRAITRKSVLWWALSFFWKIQKIVSPKFFYFSNFCIKQKNEFKGLRMLYSSTCLYKHNNAEARALTRSRKSLSLCGAKSVYREREEGVERVLRRGTKRARRRRRRRRRGCPGAFNCAISLDFREEGEGERESGNTRSFSYYACIAGCCRCRRRESTLLRDSDSAGEGTSPLWPLEKGQV